MRQCFEAILRVIELFFERECNIKYMTEQKSDNSLKSVQKMIQDYWLREQKKT
ncbi:hypothetical protein [Helicobacter bilis]|uniref:hypothetical protein n=1 Tax=Helicobacter bilis TaxID=37372 RepID=UPI001315323A|nr:hypothetical protein [Helicobacter bilis]